MHKSYREINSPYFNVSEYVLFPGLVLFAIMIISYLGLYFIGLIFTSIIYIIGLIFVNLLYHGLKNATPNGNGRNISFLDFFLVIYLFLRL